MSPDSTIPPLPEFIIPSFTPTPNFRQEAYNQAAQDKNGFSHWFGVVKESGVRHPRTLTLPLAMGFQGALLGDLPDSNVEIEIDKLVQALQNFGDEHGFPLFIKTSFTSDKHSWNDSCCLKDASRQTVLRQITGIVEFQAMFSPNLYSPELIVREMIDVNPAFHAFNGMPVTEEFRLFVRDGHVVAYQPYWPADAILDPSVEDWADRLEAIKRPTAADLDYMTRYAEQVGRKLGGHWSVDFLRCREGKLWLIDMADGDQSFVNTKDLVVIHPSQRFEP